MKTNYPKAKQEQTVICRRQLLQKRRSPASLGEDWMQPFTLLPFSIEAPLSIISRAHKRKIFFCHDIFFSVLPLLLLLSHAHTQKRVVSLLSSLFSLSSMPPLSHTLSLSRASMGKKFFCCDMPPQIFLTVILFFLFFSRFSRARTRKRFSPILKSVF